MRNYFVSFTKKINYYFAFTHHLTKPHVHSMATKMVAEAKVQLKLLDVFEDFNDIIVDMNGSIYRYSVHSGYGKCVTILFHLRKKINYYFAFTHLLTKPHVRSMATKMAAEAKVQLKLLDVFKDFNDIIVDMNGSVYR